MLCVCVRARAYTDVACYAAFYCESRKFSFNQLQSLLNKASSLATEMLRDEV